MLYLQFGGFLEDSGGQALAVTWQALAVTGQGGQLAGPLLEVLLHLQQ